MTSTFFDKDSGSDLVSVPLKGPYLDEFVRMMHETVQVLNQYSFPGAGTPWEPMMKQILQESEAAVRHVESQLQGGLFKQFGIDIRDMKTLLHNANRIPLEQVTQDEMALLGDALADGNKEPSAEVRKIAGKLVKQDIAEALLCNFSACLAMDKDRKADYVNMMLADFRNGLKRDALEQGEEEIPRAPFINMVKDMLLLEKRTERKSPMASLQSEVLFGKTPTPANAGGMLGILRERLAEITGLNPGQATEREELRSIERDFFEGAAGMLGVNLPNLPAIGRRKG